MTARARAVIFDFNGTLSDDEPLLAQLFERIFGEVGIEFPASAYFDGYAGYSDPEIVERVLDGAGHGGDGELAARLLARRGELYLEEIERRPTVLPAAAEAVRRIASAVPVAIVSGAARREIDAVLRAGGLQGLFPIVISAEDVSRGKPDPEGYLVALERLNAILPHPLDPGDVLVYEDSDHGLASAVSAGMRCVVLEGTVPVDALGAAEAVIPALDWSIPLVRESVA